MAMGTGKVALMSALLAHADQRGWVGASTGDLERETGIPEHDVVHDLWDFQKQEYVTFREKPAGSGQTSLTAIRLTSVGRRAMPMLISRPVDAAMTATLPNVVSGTIEGGTPGYNDAVFVPEGSTLEEVEAAAASAEALAEAEAPAAPTYPILTSLLQRYENRRKLEHAARLLEEAGQDDLAIQTMEAAQSFTPLETEVLNFMREVDRTDVVNV